MPTFSHTIWEDIALVLKETYKDKAYFTPETIVGTNPIDATTVTAGAFTFFGTKPLNLVILGRPVGWNAVGDVWVESWPPAGFEEAKAKHLATFDHFAVYETHIWMDYIFVNRIMADNPESRIKEMMDALSGRMETLCTDLAAFGYTYHGKIETAVEANFFHSVIDAFLARNAV